VLLEIGRDPDMQSTIAAGWRRTEHPIRTLPSSRGLC
jgi:hypothetical protein